MDTIDEYTLFYILSSLPNEWLFRCMRVNKQFHIVTLSVLRPRSFDYNYYEHAARRRMNDFIPEERRLSLQNVSKLFDGLICTYIGMSPRQWGADLYHGMMYGEDIKMFRKFRYIELHDVIIEDYLMEYFCDCEILILNNVYITDKSLKTLKKCIRLDMSSPTITNQGLKYLASLPSLKYLKLRDCHRITNEALTYFGKEVKIEVCKNK